MRFRAELHGLAEELHHLNERVAQYDAKIDAIDQGDRQARDLMMISGIGTQGATALFAAVGEDPRFFKHGRGLAAWIGLVPRQHSTGGRDRLLGISKRGDVNLLNLLIHGARAMLRVVERKQDCTSRWATALKRRRHSNVAVVAMAMANNVARVADAVMTTGQPYDPALGAMANG